MSSSSSPPKRRRLNNGAAAASSSLSVAFVGRKGAFCENAMKSYFRSSAGAGVASPGKVRMTRAIEGVPTRSAALVAAAVAKGEADFGILPMESNVSGYIRATEDALISCDGIFIVGETIYSEKHCLVAQAGVAEAAIKRVASHDHILQQCSTVIEGLGAETIASSGSAAACAMIAAGGDSMKVGSCAVEWGLGWGVMGSGRVRSCTVGLGGGNG